MIEWAYERFMRQNEKLIHRVRVVNDVKYRLEIDRFTNQHFRFNSMRCVETKRRCGLELYSS